MLPALCTAAVFFFLRGQMNYDKHTDNRYLGLTFDTQSGINVLKALLGLGYNKVSIRLMLSFALSKIEHRREKLEKMKQLLQIKDSISISSLAKALGFTRQTIYNWRDAGYIFSTDQGKIDLEETVAFWEAIDDWVQ